MTLPTRILDPGRRRILSGLLCAPIGLLAAQRATSALLVNAHGGPILPPVPMPNLDLELADGSPSQLTTQLAGKTTALQLIFTGCSTTCPMLGMTFQRLQAAIPAALQPQVQLLSLSIDPRNDTPAALTEWLSRFHVRPGWVAARPRDGELPRLSGLFGASADSLTTHSTEVLIIDRQCRLVWRTNELPDHRSLLQLLQRVSG